MNYHTNFCLLLVLLPEIIVCNKISADYTITPGMDSFGKSLKCLLQIAQETSVIKYGDQDGSCEILGLDWQTNPSFDPGYIYSWITAYERPFEEAFFVRSPLPNNFQYYSSFDIVFRTGSLVSEWFQIDIRAADSITTIVHCNFRPNDHEAVFDSFSGGYWIQDIFLSNPITLPNTEYRLTVFYGPIEWDFYVNNAHFYSFTNRHAFNGSGEVVFTSVDVLCQKIIYYPPS